MAQQAWSRSRVEVEIVVRVGTRGCTWGKWWRLQDSLLSNSRNFVMVPVARVDEFEFEFKN